MKCIGCTQKSILFDGHVSALHCIYACNLADDLNFGRHIKKQLGNI